MIAIGYGVDVCTLGEEELLSKRRLWLHCMLLYCVAFLHIGREQICQQNCILKVEMTRGVLKDSTSNLRDIQKYLGSPPVKNLCTGYRQ